MTGGVADAWAAAAFSKCTRHLTTARKRPAVSAELQGLLREMQLTAVAPIHLSHAVETGLDGLERYWSGGDFVIVVMAFVKPEVTFQRRTSFKSYVWCAGSESLEAKDLGDSPVSRQVVQYGRQEKAGDELILGLSKASPLAPVFVEAFLKPSGLAQEQGVRPGWYLDLDATLFGPASESETMKAIKAELGGDFPDNLEDAYRQIHTLYKRLCDWLARPGLGLVFCNAVKAELLPACLVRFVGSPRQQLGEMMEDGTLTGDGLLRSSPAHMAGVRGGWQLDVQKSAELASLNIEKAKETSEAIAEVLGGDSERVLAFSCPEGDDTWELQEGTDWMEPYLLPGADTVAIRIESSPGNSDEQHLLVVAVPTGDELVKPSAEQLQKLANSWEGACDGFYGLKGEEVTVERDSWDEVRLRALCAHHGWDFSWMSEDDERRRRIVEMITSTGLGTPGRAVVVNLHPAEPVQHHGAEDTATKMTCAEDPSLEAPLPRKDEKNTQGLMVIDLALELHRRAKDFAMAGDTLRAKALVESSIDQLVTAKGLVPGGRILQLLDGLLEAWHTEGIVLQAEDHDTVAELESCVADALRKVAKAPVVAAAAAKLVLGGCGTTPSTASDATTARGDCIPIDPKSGGLLNAAVAAAEARVVDDGASGVDWDAGSSRISSQQPTPVGSPEPRSPPSELEVAMEPAKNLPPSSSRIEDSGKVEVQHLQPVEEPILFDRTPGGGAALVPAGMPSEVVAAQAKRGVSAKRWPKRWLFGLCWSKHTVPGEPSTQRCQLRLARDFHRGDLIGAGSYGCVFAARRKTTGEIMAVKEMLLDRAGITKVERSERLVKLTRELRLCEQLEHPFIVSYFGHEFVMGAQGGPEKLHLFLEYCSGGSLAAQLRTYGPVSEELLRKYTQQLVGGLMYLHSRSPPVVHCDLKCANVLLTHSGDVKIADFGCSRWIQPGEAVLENSVAGSVFWMAPELFRGRGKLTTTSDIWSLGCCVLEMATGSPPWFEKRFDNILQACHVIANSEELPAIPAELSKQASTLICVCLKRNPQERPTALELNKSKMLRAWGGPAAPSPDWRGELHESGGERALREEADEGGGAGGPGGRCEQKATLGPQHVLSVDGVGAYDHISRRCMLLPVAALCYGSPSMYVFYDEEGIENEVQDDGRMHGLPSDTPGDRLFAAYLCAGNCVDAPLIGNRHITVSASLMWRATMALATGRTSQQLAAPTARAGNTVASREASDVASMAVPSRSDEATDEAGCGRPSACSMDGRAAGHPLPPPAV
ncbi:MAPKKK3 [Symbiodinium microadriaticum]|nr:MAPKKK3 [Symbiodinium microadriaticum]